MVTGRREFLGAFALGTVGAAALESLEAEEATAQGPVAGRWDLSWAKRITGRYRAVFDIPVIEDGYGVWRAAIWRKQYSTIFSIPERNLATVVVLRHDGIALGLNQEFWARYDIGKQWNVLDPATRQPSARNPVIDRTGVNTLPGEYADFTLERLMDGGAIVLGCALALRDCAAIIAEKDKLGMEAAEKRAREFLIPGLILQPSGVFAVVLAQDNGCRFVRAS